MDDSDDSTENDDWVAGGTLEASAWDLTFFDSQCITIDTSQLPDPPDANVA